MGSHLTTLHIHSSSLNRGIAISPDGTLLVVSNAETNMISVYNLPSRPSDAVVVKAEFGGKGSGPNQFDSPQKLCFSPRNSDHILIADCFNKRVQVGET